MILRYVVAMPCYNNQTSIDAAVCDVLENSEFPIILVDDGSDIPVEDCLKTQAVRHALNSGRVTVVRHTTNQGKGAALQTAFKWAVANNKTHVISFDSDGQHLASEIKKVLNCSRENPWALVIGSRKFAENVPKSSKVGRNFSNYWISYETGHAPLDSQSGLRVYPMFHVQNLSFFTKKYDFEIEILTRLLWKGVEVLDVEIEVYYPPAGERVTHFNKFWDNVRIVSLNVLFALISLVRRHDHSWRSSAALGLGVMIGCTPFFGMHTALAILASIAFRLNFTYLFIGTNISLPPIAPFLAIGSITIGHYALGEGAVPIDMPQSFTQALDFAKIFFVEWLVGSLILGSVLGSFFALCEYAAKHFVQWKKQKSQLKQKMAWTGKMRGSLFMIRIMQNIIKFMGRRAGYLVLSVIIPYFYLFAPRPRRALTQYWATIAPKKNWLLRQIEVITHLVVYGQVLIDRAYQSNSEDLKFHIDSETDANLMDATGSKKGAIFIGAHIGGWDLSTLFLKRNPASARLAMVHFLADGLNFEKVIDRSPKVDSIQTQSGNGSLLAVKSYLEEGKHVGFLADRAIGNQVELVPFFGKLAPFETRPYRIAVACQAPIIFKYNFKSGPESYLFVSDHHPKLEYSPTEDRKQQVYQWTADYAKNLEKQMRRFPHQWFNFYPFWSSMPAQWQADSGTRSDNVLLEELVQRSSIVETFQGSSSTETVT